MENIGSPLYESLVKTEAQQPLGGSTSTQFTLSSKQLLMLRLRRKMWYFWNENTNKIVTNCQNLSGSEVSYGLSKFGVKKYL